MFSFLALLLLLTNFWATGFSSNLFNLFHDLAVFLVDSIYSDPYPSNTTRSDYYYPSTMSDKLPSIYNQKNYRIEYWKTHDQEGIVKIMKTDYRKFIWHEFYWYQFPPFFESNGVLKGWDQWSSELFKVNNSNELTFFQQDLSKLLYRKYYSTELIKH